MARTEPRNHQSWSFAPLGSSSDLWCHYLVKQRTLKTQAHAFYFITLILEPSVWLRLVHLSTSRLCEELRKSCSASRRYFGPRNWKFFRSLYVRARSGGCTSKPPLREGLYASHTDRSFSYILKCGNYQIKRAELETLKFVKILPMSVQHFRPFSLLYACIHTQQWVMRDSCCRHILWWQRMCVNIHVFGSKQSCISGCAIYGVEPRPSKTHAQKSLKRGHLWLKIYSTFP